MRMHPSRQSHAKDRDSLKQSLKVRVETRRAKSQFEHMKKSRAPLRRFVDAPALVTHLSTKAGDLDEKDKIYAALDVTPAWN